MKLKKYLAWLILFSFACGPSTDYNQYFSVFYPEAANNPVASQAYFYTNDYLNQQFYMDGSAYLADSLNIESWVNYSDNKISAAAIKSGLYDKASGLPLAKKLRSAGKKEAADYVMLAQKIDKETEKYASYWEGIVVNEQLLANLRAKVLKNAAKTSDDFLKERYTFQALKIDGKLNDPAAALKDYKSLKDTYKNKTFISEWSQSRYAGALLYHGDTAQAVLEFAKVFEISATRRNQADLSVRRLPKRVFRQALAICQNSDEQVAVYALEAIQPNTDGLSLLKRIVALKPNHPLLELVMAREINKNELNFYANKNAGRNSFGINVYDKKYSLDQAKVALIKSKGEFYFEKLLAFNKAVLKNENIKKKAYWYTSAAYLQYVGGNTAAVDTLLNHAEKESTENAYLQKQIAFLKTMNYIDHNSITENEAKILSQISAYKDISSFRDNNLLVALTEKLTEKYTVAIQPPKKQKRGWLSSCTNPTEKAPVFSRNKVKAFLAQNIPNYIGYSLSETEADLFRTADANLLKNTISFLSSNLSAAEKKLLILANINEDELLMAYGRKLIRTQQYTEALAVFKKCSTESFYEGAFPQYFSPIPDQFIIGELIDEDLLSPLVYLEKASAYQQATLEKPNDARAWYNLGLAAYNMSYWGNGWLFSDREWSQLEIQYGKVTGEDYFTNYFAKECFEKALVAKPDPELGAMICYMGALCERNQYFIAYTNGEPNSYKEEELNYYRIKMETSVKPTFQSFFKRLKNKYEDAEYESQVIKECMLYANFKMQ